MIGAGSVLRKSPEEKYWDTRYEAGRTSGGFLFPWKWDVIEEFLPRLDHVVDVACGDLLLWEGRDLEDYTGIDVSKVIIERNRVQRPRWRFIHSPAEDLIPGLKKPMVLCISLLFHVMDEDRYIRILHNLCHYSSEVILIYTWLNNPFGDRKKGPFTDGVYQYFRRFEEYVHLFMENGFGIVSMREAPDGIGAFYLFKKVSIVPTEYYDFVYSRDKHYRGPPEKSPYYRLWSAFLKCLEPGCKILDVGCGPGQFARLCVDAGHPYVGLDYSPEAIKLGRACVPEVEFHKVDVEVDRFLIREGNYDVATFIEFFEHVEDDLGILAAVPPGKNVIFSVPNYGGYGHFRFFDSMESVQARYGSLVRFTKVGEFAWGTSHNRVYVLVGVRAP